MININSLKYWDKKFSTGNWGRTGRRQTIEYAKSNIMRIPLKSDFDGTILDYGCAFGDAVPIYKNKYKKASIVGLDISEYAIYKCRKKYGHIATFVCGSYHLINNYDIIIVSHVMEHIENDKKVIYELLKKCGRLFVFVPYKEDPLYYEHVNYYDEHYYDEIGVNNINTFTIRYKQMMSYKSIIKYFIIGRPKIYKEKEKNIIMYEFIGLV